MVRLNGSIFKQFVIKTLRARKLIFILSPDYIILININTQNSVKCSDIYHQHINKLGIVDGTNIETGESISFYLKSGH